MVLNACAIGHSESEETTQSIGSSVSMTFPTFLKVLISPAKNGSSKDDVYVEVQLTEILGNRTENREGYPSFEKLRSHLISLGILREVDSKFCIRYQDEKGDMVALTSDAALSRALVTHAKDALKIKVVRNPPGHGKYLKAADGRYLIALNDGTLKLASKVEEWDAWDVIKLHGNKIAFRSSYDTFLAGHKDGSLFLQAFIGGWERWSVVPCGEKVAFCSHHNTYLGISDKGTMRLTDQIRKWDHWIWQ